MQRMRNHGSASSDDFVGREREVSELRAALAGTGTAPGRLILLSGDPGIGKTRLAEELSAEATRIGRAVHWGRCRDGGGVPTLWPWIQIARSVAASQAGGGGGGALARLRNPGPALTPDSAQGFDAGGGDSERFRFFDGVASALAEAAAVSPLLVVIDDLHAADEGSLLLLEFIARQLVAAPILVVVTYREPEARAEPRRAELFTTLCRLGKRLPLGGLTRDEVGRLIGHILAAAPEQDLISSVHALTEGNPFFVDEVVRLLSARGIPSLGGLRSDGLAIPSTVRDVVRERLLALSAECRETLGVASVIGREADVALVAEVTESETLAVLDRLEGATKLGVIDVAGGRLSFAHALLRETLYGDLQPSQRASLHRRVAEAIERRNAGALDEHLADLAHHFSRGAAAQAIDYAERAAERALGLLAYEDAAQHYALALEALPLLAEPEARAARSLPLLLGLGQVQTRAGDATGARATFALVMDAARTRDVADLFARAALGYAGVGLGIPSGTVDHDLVALLEEGLTRLGPARPELRARLLARLALELYFSASATRRSSLMEEASSLARDLDGDTQAYVGHARLVGLWDLTPPATRVAWCNELLALAQQLGADELALRAHSYRLLEIIDGGEAERWEAELDSLSHFSTRLREPRFLGMALGTRAMRSLWLGRFAEAEAMGQKAVELAQSRDEAQTEIIVGLQTFQARRLQGRFEEAEALAQFSVTRLPEVPGTHCMMGLVHCDLGRLDQARAELELIGDTGFTRLRSQNRISGLLPWLAELTALLGDGERAEVIYRELAPLAGRNVSLQTRVCFGPAAYYLGLLARTLGRREVADAHLEQALDEARRMDGEPLIALILLEQARAALAAGDEKRGRDLLAQTRQLAGRLGMEATLATVARLEATPGAETTSPAVDSTASTSVRRATLRREGDLWTIATDDLVLRCKDGKGLRYISHLLRQPGKSLHALELVALEEQGLPPEAGLAGVSRAHLERLGMHVGRPDEREPASDAQALRQYRARLEELRDELEEAERFNDTGRATHLREEIEVLSHSLAAATGLGGRMRPSGTSAERARLNVTRAIRSIIARIGEGHPEIGRHLARTIRTGSFCRYAPEASERIEWSL